VHESNRRDAPHAIDATPARWFGRHGRVHPTHWLSYAQAMADPAFIEELAFYRKQFIGGPTPLYKAERLSEAVGGATIWLKREELAHTGAHKINNAVGQAELGVLYLKGLGVCRGFTPSTRVVSRREGGGWSLFRF
jgi:hypothetical protein